MRNLKTITLEEISEIGKITNPERTLTTEEEILVQNAIQKRGIEAFETEDLDFRTIVKVVEFLKSKNFNLS